MSLEAPVLEVKNLEVIRGGVPVLSIPSLSIAESEVLFLIGPNGAGKSTLLQTLAALVKPSQGEIRFRGKKVGEDISLLSYRRRLAMILQEPLLFNTTVYKNVASGLKIRGMNKKEIEPIVIQTLDRFGISHLKDRSARTLSGGEARRTSIARAFATGPEILFLDEPFSALDPIIREAMMEDLEKVLRETGITTVFVTHDRIEALRLATRLGVMADGRIIQIGDVGEIMNHPENEIVASLVGVDTILQGKIIENRDRSVIISVSGKEIEAVGDIPPGTHVTLCIRPENVFITKTAPTGETSVRNTIKGRIDKIIPLGLYHKLSLDCGFPMVSYVTHHSLSSLLLKPGEEVFASFKATAIHVIQRKN